MTSIDLNADLGEGAGTDAELLEIISSASIACGGHAGDEATMREVMRMAKARGVRCGAHPGFADRENFGRVRLDLPAQKLAGQIRLQLETIKRIAAEEAVPLEYVKLHGALANMAAEDETIATTAFRVAAEILPGTKVLAIDNSAQVHAAEVLGIEVIREAYADRRYAENGLLLPRTEPGAVLETAEEVVAQVVAIARDKTIVTSKGYRIGSKATSICMHGDTPSAVTLANEVKNHLVELGISVRAM